jgi:hypothetical protein
MTQVRELIKGSVASLGGDRPYSGLQKQIETAHNSGDTTLRDKLIKKLPKDMQTGMTYTGRATVDPITHKIVVK